MEWPPDFYAQLAGETCPLCAQGRPEETPHGLRHYCASHLYQEGMTLKAIQELMGHSWLSTTTQYIHVHSTHIETSWAAANTRALERLATTSRPGTAGTDKEG